MIGFAGVTGSGRSGTDEMYIPTILGVLFGFTEWPNHAQNGRQVIAKIAAKRHVALVTISRGNDISAPSAS